MDSTSGGAIFVKPRESDVIYFEAWGKVAARQNGQASHPVPRWRDHLGRCSGSKVGILTFGVLHLHEDSRPII